MNGGNLMLSLLKTYKKRWALVDVLIALDVFQNAVNHTGYDDIAQLFGIEPALVNSIVSLIELARFAILAHQGSKVNPSKSA